ncbi:MAG TPA: hypothetical protein VGQ83_28395 [Polyangia bacterium]|jgi:histone H3/H4
MAKKPAPKGAAKGAKKDSSHEVLVVGSKVKDVIRAAGLRTSGDLVEALSERVHSFLAGAVERAQKNGRATVNPHDL